MMTLNTVSKQVSDKNVLVYWRVGTRRKGVLDVRMSFPSDDQEIIAELIAIRHLVMENEVFGCIPTAGKGFRFAVSKGAIRKMAQGRSDKAFASRFASLITGRMEGVTIVVSRSMEFMPQEERPGYSEYVEVLEASAKEYSSPYEVIETPSIGTLSVTRHAVRRYEERLSSVNAGEVMGRPWASLLSRLRNPDLEMSPLDDKVIRHKMRRYGSNNKVEIWSHPTDKLRYTVVVRPDDTKILVTVFERNQEYLSVLRERPRTSSAGMDSAGSAASPWA